MKMKNLMIDILKIIFKQELDIIQEKKLKEILEIDIALLKKALKVLKNYGFISTSKGSVHLTRGGKKISIFLAERNIPIESFFKQIFNKNDENEIINFMDHQFTDDILMSFKKSSGFKISATPLTHYNLSAGTIVDVKIDDFRFFSRLISMGLFPGQRLEILSKNPTTYLISVKNAKIAIDRDLASAILMTP
ncbi:MAG: FeoA family protein [Promethearchaeota archaeon]